MGWLRIALADTLELDAICRLHQSLNMEPFATQPFRCAPLSLENELDVMRVMSTAARTALQVRYLLIYLIFYHN